MAFGEVGSERRTALERVLGYLNFSAGATDPSVQALLNRLYAEATRQIPEQTGPAWRILRDWLFQALGELTAESAAFRDAGQAQVVAALTFDEVLPAYRAFHRDLLFHQTDESLFQPFFIGRAFEAVLQQGAPWTDRERIISGAVGKLNDYIGHRPVAVLETQKREPYPHEWVRPLPLFIRDAGVTVGIYHRIVATSLAILRNTPDVILRAAQFDPDLLDELSVDPRAYDFDHPVNRRPNYHFGQWDPHCIDLQGRYRRFVLQEVTLSSLLRRVETTPRRDREELEYEAAVVLAGTILMASGISGGSPNAFESTLSLADLLPTIAEYRDAFYHYVIESMQGPHGDRLRREAARRKQPFGGARQHLNAELARRRASQMEHVHLARVFAAMGYPESAAKQASVVPVASARMLCQIDCLLTEGRKRLERGELMEAAKILPEAFDLLQRGIQCGAIVDPWNILGFDAQFSLFPAAENSVFDHRVEDLLKLMQRIFALYSAVWSEAAAVNARELCVEVERQFRTITEWWRQFAAHECTSIKSQDPDDTFQAAKLVASALGMWHQGGAATGDVAFWAPHAAMFPSPEAYSLVTAALLDRHDYVASMALLMHWLSETPRIPLLQGDSSFFRLAARWLTELAESAAASDQPDVANKRWAAAHKFFDFLEANAGDYWHAPAFQTGDPRIVPDEEQQLEEAENGEEAGAKDIVSAAYEDMTYQDETDDGFDSQVFEFGPETEDEFDVEARRLFDRISFLRCVARLWKIAAIHRGLAVAGPAAQQKAEALKRWSEQAQANRRGLMQLIHAIDSFHLPTPSGDHDSMVDYDRRMMARDSMLEHVIYACVDTVDASRLLMAAAMPDAAWENPDTEWMEGEDDEREAVGILAALLRGDAAAVRRRWPKLEAAFRSKSLLYVPVSKGGEPQLVVAARVRKRTIQDLLAWLPRAGLLVEGCRLIELARQMDRINTVGAGAVTEFDELFTLGYKSLVESILESYPTWTPGKGRTTRRARERELVSCLEKLTETMLMSWLSHSQTLRLSVLEYLYDDAEWRNVVEFIERYGHDLFTQRFLGLPNIRAILHQGAENWFDQLQENSKVNLRLIDELDHEISREKAARLLTLILDAVLENYVEYRDYNSTTTQSDRGELLFILLDFLRLQARYERICWNLRPVVLAHETLARRGYTDVARDWRRELAARIRDKANEFVASLRRLQRRYAIMMPTVADRIQERFVQTLTIDRIRALVEPAIREARLDEKRSFELLERDTEMLTRQPSGAGLDLPTWLEALEDEVDRLRRPVHARDDDETLRQMIPVQVLSYDETLAQLKTWSAEIAKSAEASRFRWAE